MNVKLRPFMMACILGLLFAIIAYIFSVDIYTSLSVEIFVISVCILSSDYSKNIFFIMFLSSFFIFLISGDYVEYLFNRHYYRTFESASIEHAHFAIFLSILSLIIGYAITKDRGSSNDLKINDELAIKYSSIRKAAMIVFYPSFVILLFDKINAVFFVLTHSYFSYYLSYDPVLPNAIIQLGDLAPMALCVYLATLPSKDECKKPVMFFCIYAIVGFLVGQRGALVYNMAFIIGYYLYRNKHYNDGNVWITKRTIKIMILSIPFAIVLLMVYGYIREGQEIVYKSFGDTIVSFFVNIGSSSMTIKYGYMYQDQIPGFKLYSFGGLINYFKYSSLFSWFNGVTQYPPHSAGYALNSSSFDSFLSYVAMSNRYIGGEGVGSSFVAELFADFGYIGIVIGSLLYGYIFKKIANINPNKWVFTTCQLYILLALMKSPRGSYGVFASEVVNLTFIFCLVVISSISSRLKQ